ncbi:MAG: MFS transporter [Aquabacterium sp.]|nr:MFS transporter [Aquabacterium sp.]
MQDQLPETSNVQGELGRMQLAWLAAAILVVSTGYGALMPLLPTWLALARPDAAASDIADHVGFITGVYAFGVLMGAPFWGLVSDRVGRKPILIMGLAGYVASLLLLLAPSLAGLSGLYALRCTSGFFVAAVIPVVSALIAEHTRPWQRARRFAWLGAVSLIGFLFGPWLNAAADWISQGALRGISAPQVVVVLSALLGAATMAGQIWTLPHSPKTPPSSRPEHVSDKAEGFAALCGLDTLVMFALSGFEVGIMLQGQQHPDLSSRQVSMMFAECSLVMLGVNAVLFFSELLERTPPRKLICVGLLLAITGLALLAWHRAEAWMYLGVSLTSAGTGLVLPVIAYVAAGAERDRLGVTMGGLAAASSVGQIVGSAVGGWLFGVAAQHSYGWLTAPLVAILALVLLRPALWARQPSPQLQP